MTYFIFYHHVNAFFTQFLTCEFFRDGSCHLDFTDNKDEAFYFTAQDLNNSILSFVADAKLFIEEVKK